MQLITSDSLLCEAPSHLGSVEEICPVVRHFLERRGLSALGFRTELVLRECLNNAIDHGNRNDPSKDIQLSLSIIGRTVYLTVADEGEGFDWSHVRHSPPPSRIPRGRGLPVITSVSPNVSFNRKGNLIRAEICEQQSRRASQ